RALLSLPRLLCWPLCLRFQFPHTRRQSGLPKAGDPLGLEDEAEPTALAPILPPCAVALASGHCNINNSLAVPTWRGAQAGTRAGHIMQPHSRCSPRGRLEAQVGTATRDTLCGNCQPGWFAPSEVPRVPCQPCSWTPLGTRGCYGETRQPGNSTRAGSPEETAAQYAVIAIVPIFCLMGLLGILVCNLLKRKGYHCTAHKEVGPGPGGGGSGVNPAYQTEDANEDTIGVLVRLITEKKENAAALEELLKDMLHVCPHRHHLHTVQGLASLSGPCCSRCSQKWPEVLLSPEAAAATTPTPRLLPNPARAPKVGAKAGRQGEITILSVGRFRVARIPEQRTSSVASEVKTITEAGPSGGDLPDSPRCGLSSEQRALLGSGGSHPKWLKPPAENKAEENRYVVRLSESNLVI
ncbi:hypothetical protein E2I00_018565, partial [Balaenoptera physalus]